jgi:hypothetical protein
MLSSEARLGEGTVPSGLLASDLVMKISMPSDVASFSGDPGLIWRKVD